MSLELVQILPVSLPKQLSKENPLEYRKRASHQLEP